MFGFQYLLQAGVFFVVPLFLSVVLGLSAIETGVRILPLSFSLLAAALGVPRLWPRVSPRRVVRIGVLLMLAGILVLMSGVDLDASAGVVLVPMLLVGLGIGALASQLGAVTVSAVPDEQSGEVGGLQNTATNLGASIGTALAGSVLIGILAASFLAGIQQNPAVPPEVTQQAQVQLEAGVPFLSDAQLSEQLQEAGVSPSVSEELVTQNHASRSRPYAPRSRSSPCWRSWRCSAPVRSRSANRGTSEPPTASQGRRRARPDRPRAPKVVGGGFTEAWRSTA